MIVTRSSLQVFEDGTYICEGEDGKKLEANSWVGVFYNDSIYRHKENFSTRADAVTFMLKIFAKADIRGQITLNPKYWRAVELEMAC